MDAVARLIATFVGAGAFPVAPATFASFIVALLVYAAGPGPGGRGMPLPEAILILVLLPIAIWSSNQAEKSLGHDAHPIVIDEVVGQLIALWMVPRTWPWVLAGFLLFRLFDIWKPLGARQAQDLPGGVGIVIDDVMAGLYALIVLQVALRFIPA